MPREPSLAEVIRTAIDSRLLDAHTALPGRIKFYAPATQTAEVEILVQRATPNAEEDAPVVHESPPIIPNVPVVWSHGGGFHLRFPIAVGDEGMLIFSEASMGKFRETGDLAAPGDLRRHSMSSAVFLPVCLSEGKVFPGPPPADGTALIATPGGGFLQVSAPGASGEFVALAALVTEQLNILKSAIGGAAVVASDGGASFKAALVSALGTWPGSIASSSLKAE